MDPRIDLLLFYGGKLLLEQSASLVVLVDAAGRLLEWNACFDRRISPLSVDTKVQELLDTYSGPRLERLIDATLAGHTVGPVIVNFVQQPRALPQSYRCWAKATVDGQVVLLAEPLAALDHEAAEQYILVTNELALTARTLAKARFELEQKQRQLEEALAQVQQLAQIDELTRILNRRSVMQRLDEETTRTRRYHSPCSLLLIDIDHFKLINDRYGHPVGDQVLRECAELLQRSIRSTDHLGRYGGEEFLAILPMTGAVAAAELAERLRTKVERQMFTVSGTVAFNISISIGSAEFDPELDTPALLVAHADSALYEAKAAGRNCCRVWNPPGAA